MPQNATTDEDLLAKFVAGQGVDWKRKSITAKQFSEILRDCSKQVSGPTSFAILNAIIEGDVYLDGIGDFGAPVALQIIGCEIRGGFRARGSRWRQLAIAKCAIQWIDIPGSRFDSDLLLEGVKSGAWLELRGSRIGGTLALTDSEFAKGNRGYALELSETHVGLGVKGVKLRASGRVNAEQLRVEGSLALDGAKLSVPMDETVALDLKGAKIGGEVRLCFGFGHRFEANGIIVCVSAEFGALILRGSKISGRENVSFVGDHLVIRETLDAGGLTAEDDPSFEAVGKMRFIGARIGRQFQLYDAKLTANDDFALSLDSCQIGADVIIGHQASKLSIHGGVSANSLTVGGRFILAGATLVAKLDALSMREAKISGEVAIYDTRSKGALRLDSVKANQVSIDDLTIERTSQQPDGRNFPQDYAHPEDALLDFGFAEITGHLRLDKLTLTGGDLRFIGVKVDGGFQASRITIRSHRHAIVGQSAKIKNGFYIAGTRQTPAVVEGKFNLMGAQIEGDVLIVDAHLGSSAAPIEFYMRGTRIDGGVNLTRVVLLGELNASATIVSQDFIFNGSQLIAPGKTSCDLRTARISGVLQFAQIGSGQETMEVLLDGELAADGAEVGALEWYNFRLAEEAKLRLTNMRVARKIHAGELIPSGDAYIDLTGTSVPELTDSLDDSSDGWGAGRAVLILDGFRYERLTYPSGREGGLVSDVRYWRSLWLQRRANQRSSRPAYQLLKVLREQGMFEASRLVLIDAFAAEGRASPTFAGRVLAWVWGFAFGFGLSGSRALMTLAFWWLIGVWGVAYLENSDLLVTDTRGNGPAQSCADQIDPFIFSADVMLPVLDLGEEKLCHVGLGPKAENETAFAAVDIAGKNYDLSRWQVFRLLVAGYAICSWLLLSLAIATWSGIFRRNGRE